MRHPPRTRIGTEVYDAGVLLVTDRDERGRPLVARFVHDDQTVDVKELSASGKPPEFIIVYVNRRTWGRP